MRPSKISFLFFCLIGCFFSFAQEVDSLRYYVDLSKNPQKPEDLSNAYIFINKEKDKLLEMEQYDRVLYSWYHLASIDYNLGFYNDSEASLTRALKLLDTKPINDSNWYRKSIYTLFGILYREQNNEETSIKMYENAFEYAKDSEDSLTLYNNWSNLYKDAKDYKSAKNILQKALPLLVRVSDTLAKARMLDNLGFSYSKLNQKGADSLLFKALKLRRQKKSLKGIFASYMSLSEHCRDQLKYVLANDYSLKALDIANVINSVSYKEHALKFLVESGNSRYAKDYVRLNDSLYNSQKARENKFALMKYNVSKKELELKTLELEKERSEKLNVVYLALAGFIMLFSLYLYFVIKSKHKKEKIKEVYLKETQLSKKVHDELANDMSDLMNYVESEIDVSNAKKAPLLNHLEDVYLRTRDISTEIASVDLINFSESLRNLLLQHNRQNTKVIINDTNTIDWLNVQDHIKMVVYRCLQELMVNMKKHSQAKLVSIVFKAKGTEHEIRYVDDGIGVSMSEIRSNGLQNVEYRINSIGGTFSFDTSKGNGFKATLMFKS